MVATQPRRPHSDGLIVRDAGISDMIQVLTGLVENGEFTQILQRLED
ncbi:hypothetical protein [Streptomyces lienomycini]|nr:hypothetical protein [Streptomyces lienomycini]